MSNPYEQQICQALGESGKPIAAFKRLHLQYSQRLHSACESAERMQNKGGKFLEQTIALWDRADEWSEALKLLERAMKNCGVEK